MKVILLGAPGAGKGTVAKLLSEYDGSVQISTGDILRAAVNAGTALGKEAKAYMDRGDLVPDALIMKIMESRIQEPDCTKGFLLDGFPRTITQAKELRELLKRLVIKLDMVINLEVPKDVILDRLTTRRTCSDPACQEIYNVKSNPPAEGGKCRKCGAPVIQRADETEEAILNRLVTYNSKTAPLVEFYKEEGLLKTFVSLNSRETSAAIARGLAENNTRMINYEKLLNSEQFQAVTTGSGPVLVIAGAGSGKTRTLTYRVARLLENGTRPENILLATFTNKAAAEMLLRVGVLTGIDIRLLWGGTFHHLANRVLRRHAGLLGYGPGYTILDSEDSEKMVNSCIAEIGVDRKDGKFPRGNILCDILGYSLNTGEEIESVVLKRYPYFNFCPG